MPMLDNYCQQTYLMIIMVAKALRHNTLVTYICLVTADDKVGKCYISK